MPLLDTELFSSVSCRGCQQEPPPATSRHDLALVPLRVRLRSVTSYVFALDPTSLPFARRPLRCDGGVSDPNARSRRRPTERAGRHLEPRTTKRLLQLHTTHARVHERATFAPMMVLATTSFPAPRACARQCEEANHVSSTGSKDRTPISCEWAEKEHTGRRAEPKAEGDAPGIAFSSRGFRRNTAAEASLRARRRSSVPSSFSLRAPRCRQRGFEYGAGVPVRNSVSRRRLPVSAFTFQPHQPPSRSFRTELRLEATNVPPAPRRETAAWQPRCFPPLGIDVHGARALCVHRQVLRPRWCPFDRVPLPLEEGDSPLRFGEAAPFFTSRFCPTSTVSSSASNFGGPLAEHRIDFFPREFSRGCRYGIVRLGRPGQVIEGSLRSSRRWPRARRVSCLTSGPGRPQRPKTASTIASARGN